MKTLAVPFIHQDMTQTMEGISRKMDHIHQEIIANVPWQSYPYKPEVAFVMAHSEESIFLKYYVEEKHVRVVNSEPNQPVYEDTCVEFFISLDGEKEYYNFEFNCAGTCLLGFGEDRMNRELIHPDLIKKISFLNVIKPATNKDANWAWELSLSIPLTVLKYHNFSTLSGKKCRANFYKCGDKLPEPHFLTWNPIKSDSPNFHLSEFFGNLEFR